MKLKAQLNSSLLCLLPLIGEDNLNFTNYIDLDNSFVNGFASDINKPWLDCHLFLVFSSSHSTPLKIVKNLVENDFFVQQYTYRLKGLFYTVYVFEVPKEFERDYKLMLNGDYTHILHQNKVKLLTFWDSRADSDLFKALFTIHGRSNLNDMLENIIEEKDYIEPYIDVESSL